MRVNMDHVAAFQAGFVAALAPTRNTPCSYYAKHYTLTDYEVGFTNYSVMYYILDITFIGFKSTAGLFWQFQIVNIEK